MKNTASQKTCKPQVAVVSKQLYTNFRLLLRLVLNIYAGVFDGEEFCERRVWAGVAGEWRPLFGSLATEGVSVEWHDFECGKTLDWSRSFHPESFEICVNFDGCGTIHEHPAITTIVNPQRVAYYAADETRLRADRHAGQVRGESCAASAR